MRPSIACLLAVPFFFSSAAVRAQQQPPAPPPNLPLVRLIATGGTIAMKIDPEKKAPVPAISGEDLVATVPEISKVARVEVENLSNVPSAYMDPFLDLTVDSPKPVVLIGAQRNASERDFDGPRNLLNAARICVDAGARGKGAMIALNNNISAARDAVKTHTSDVETFKSGDLGFIGYADYDRIVWYRAPLRRQHVALKPLAEGQHLPRVDVVAMYGGADGALVRAAVAAGAKGLVIQALGWGNMNVPMFQAVKEAIGKGIPVAITTRVWTGRVLPNYGFEGGGKTLQQAGAIFADNLSPQKARILLMLALQTTAAGPEIQKMFDR